MMRRDLERYSVMPPLNEVDVPDVATEIAATGERVPYEALVALLSETDSARIALYLPDAWLPDGEVSIYRKTYVDAWWSLLGQVDQRADFVDGDIGELGGSESRPMVVKAAHLIPALKSHRLITDRDVDAIYRGTDSGILQASIDDARQYQQVQLQDAKRRFEEIPRLQRELDDISSSKTDTIARQRWLRAQMTDQLVRDVARDMSRNETEYLMDQSSPLETQIALHALARHLRHGTMSQDQLAYIERHHKFADSIDVRHRSARALRQLYQVGAIEHEVLDRNDISLPHLSGRWSENLAQMTPEVAQLREVVAEISNSPLLAGALYPVVALGGSRLKGYGESKADIDTVVFVRQGPRPRRQRGHDGARTPQGSRSSGSDPRHPTRALTVSRLEVGASRTHLQPLPMLHPEGCFFVISSSAYRRVRTIHVSYHRPHNCQTGHGGAASLRSRVLQMYGESDDYAPHSLSLAIHHVDHHLVAPM